MHAMGRGGQHTAQQRLCLAVLMGNRSPALCSFCPFSDPGRAMEGGVSLQPPTAG